MNQSWYYFLYTLFLKDKQRYLLKYFQISSHSLNFIHISSSNSFMSTCTTFSSQQHVHVGNLIGSNKRDGEMLVLKDKDKVKLNTYE